LPQIGIFYNGGENMDFERKINELGAKIDQLVGKHQEIKDENINLKRSLEGKEKEINHLQEEVEKLRQEKKEAAKSLEIVIGKISKFFEGKSNESLL
jgi:archaellum component FlaC